MLPICCFVLFSPFPLLSSSLDKQLCQVSCEALSCNLLGRRDKLSIDYLAQGNPCNSNILPPPSLNGGIFGTKRVPVARTAVLGPTRFASTPGEQRRSVFLGTHTQALTTIETLEVRFEHVSCRRRHWGCRGGDGALAVAHPSYHLPFPFLSLTHSIKLAKLDENRRALIWSESDRDGKG